MSCSNPFCTCCQRAYVEGLLDGYQVGYKRGYKNGYVSGYVQAALRITPPEEYQPAILTRLAPYLQPPAEDPILKALLRPRYPRPRLLCGCTDVCTCNRYEKSE